MVELQPFGTILENLANGYFWRIWLTIKNLIGYVLLNTMAMTMLMATVFMNNDFEKHFKMQFCMNEVP